MISIHLRRMGASGDPHYRVVVADSRNARDGAFIEVLGHYHPRFEPAKVELDVEKTKAWIAKGAQPSDTVKSLLRKVEQGALAVGEAVSPSRQRDAARHAEKRASEPAAAAEPEADTEAGAEAAGDGGEQEAAAAAEAGEEVATETPSEETAEKTESAEEEEK